MGKIRSLLVPGVKSRLLDTFHAAKLIADWRDDFDIDISNELNGISKISLYRCETSHLDFFSPASAAGSDQLYRNLQKFDWFYMPEKWEFDQAIKDLEGSRRILEVGCGPGFFIKNAIKKLKGGEVKGIELNKSNIQQAFENNLPIEYADVRELAANGESFDAVCSFQVLEHVPQPRDFLKAIVKVLEPRGKLIICVPNKDSFLKHQYNLLDMPPHHMTRWNSFTFRYLEKLFPLKLERICYEPLAQYHIHGYVMAYGQYWRDKLPLARYFLSESRLAKITSSMIKGRLYRFLRGQSLYIRFKKI